MILQLKMCSGDCNYVTQARSEPTSDPVKLLITGWVALSTLVHRMYWANSIANSGVISFAHKDYVNTWQDLAFPSGYRVRLKVCSFSVFKGSWDPVEGIWNGPPKLNAACELGLSDLDLDLHASYMISPGFHSEFESMCL